MAKFKANEEQLEFINSDGYNVLVSASAGSGKTSTMIQKLAKILSEKKIPITSLLVVTYTNAAGSEIKQKLYDALSSLILETKDFTQISKLNDYVDSYDKVMAAYDIRNHTGQGVYPPNFWFKDIKEVSFYMVIFL